MYADQVAVDFVAFQAAVASGQLAGGEATQDIESYRAIMRNPTKEPEPAPRPGS